MLTKQKVVLFEFRSLEPEQMANRKRQKGGKAKNEVAEQIPKDGIEKNGKKAQLSVEEKNQQYNDGTRTGRGDATPRNGFRSPFRYSERKKAR